MRRPTAFSSLLACALSLQLGALPVRADPPAAQKRPANAIRQAAASQQIAVAFPAGRTMVEVPFRLEANKIIVPVEINGAGPFEFVLDTGAAQGFFSDAQAARRVDLTFAGTGQAAGAGAGGAPIALKLATGVRFDVGGVVLSGSRLAVAAKEIGMLKTVDWHGVFGHQIFDNLVIEIDWQASMLRLHDPEHFEAAAEAASLPIRVTPGRSYIVADVEIGDAPARRVKLVIDTGASHALSLAPSGGAPPERRYADTVLGHGLGGVVRGAVGRIERLTLGGFALAGVITDFADPSHAGALNSGADGNLGAETLRRFRTTFDYGNERLLLEPNDAFETPFAFSTSGLYLQPWPDEEGNAVVEGIYPRSPAQRIGIGVGTRIVALDGQPIQILGLDELNRRLEGAPGTVVRLAIEHDGEVRTLVLTLAELL